MIIYGKYGVEKFCTTVGATCGRLPIHSKFENYATIGTSLDFPKQKINYTKPQNNVKIYNNA